MIGDKHTLIHADNIHVTFTFLESGDGNISFGHIVDGEYTRINFMTKELARKKYLSMIRHGWKAS